MCICRSEFCQWFHPSRNRLCNLRKFLFLSFVLPSLSLLRLILPRNFVFPFFYIGQNLLHLRLFSLLLQQTSIFLSVSLFSHSFHKHLSPSPSFLFFPDYSFFLSVSPRHSSRKLPLSIPFSPFVPDTSFPLSIPSPSRHSSRRFPFHRFLSIRPGSPPAIHS